MGVLHGITLYHGISCHFVHSLQVTPDFKTSILTHNLLWKAAETGISFLILHTQPSIHSPSVTAFNSSSVFKPVGLIIQQGNQSIIWSETLLLPWSARHSSIAWRAHKGARSLGKLEVCAGRCCHLFQSTWIPVLSLFQTASGNVEAKVVCFYRRRDISHSLIQLADKHASE